MFLLWVLDEDLQAVPPNSPPTTGRPCPTDGGRVMGTTILNKLEKALEEATQIPGTHSWPGFTRHSPTFPFDLAPTLLTRGPSRNVGDGLPPPTHFTVLA